MKPIDFTQYPKIYPYVKDLIGKSFFKPFQYSLMTEECFIQIVEGWVEKFEKNIDVMVENTLLIYDLTCEQTGYDVLSHSWTRYKEVFKMHERPKRFDKELVRKWWVERFTSCISHLYQNMNTDYNKEIRGGATGCMLTCSFHIWWVDSDRKGVDKIAVSDFTMVIQIEDSLHAEIDNIKD